MLESNRLRAERVEGRNMRGPRENRNAETRRRIRGRGRRDRTDGIVRFDGTGSVATSLTRTAEETQQLSGRVEAASEEASSNVRSVAAATEEMTASIAEISRQVQESNRIAGEAVSRRRPPTRASTNCRRRRADRRCGQSDHDDRRADQSAGPERHHRGGARGRFRPGLCGCCAGGEGARCADRQRNQRNQQQIAGMQVATQDSVVAIKQIGATISRISEIAASRPRSSSRGAPRRKSPAMSSRQHIHLAVATPISSM